LKQTFDGPPNVLAESCATADVDVVGFVMSDQLTMPWFNETAA
jgi:hypothetical protein